MAYKIKLSLLGRGFLFCLITFSLKQKDFFTLRFYFELYNTILNIKFLCPNKKKFKYMTLKRINNFKHILVLKATFSVD